MLDAALARLDAAPNVVVKARSGYVTTAPVGGPARQGEFLNAVAVIETNRTPQSLAELLWEIERQLGRGQHVRWAPRVIDLDLLLYEDQVIETPLLVVPHPRLAFRRFVLAPACQVAAEMVHPVVGWTLGSLLAHLDSAAEYVALAGLPGSGRTRLAKALASIGQARIVFDPASAEERAVWQAEAEGRNPALHLALWQRRTTALREALSSQDRGETLVSDFWLGQTLALARASLDPRAWDDVRSACSATASEELCPKLLVLLDRSIGQSPALVVEHLPGELQPNGERQVQFREALLEQVARPNRGPVLRLDASDRERCAVETSAAIAAMR
jgi:2-amino-4-hydroxy-6-hydroxymethyldihydropteridine diphosphokinase